VVVRYFFVGQYCAAVIDVANNVSLLH